MSNCEIPDRPLGGGEYLSDLQRIDLFNNLREGLEKLAKTIVPVVAPRDYLRKYLRMLVDYHVNKKIEHFGNLGAIRFGEIEKRWLGLLEKIRFDIIFQTFFELYERAKSTEKIQLDRCIEPREDGMVIVISVAMSHNVMAFVDALAVTEFVTDNRYIDFILEQRKCMYRQAIWSQMDFVHLMYSEESDDVLFDMLFIENYDLRHLISAYCLGKGILKKGADGVYSMPKAVMYPTSVMNTMDMTLMMEKIEEIEVIMNA